MIMHDDFKAIAELDLDPIKVKLMHKESGEGWTLEYANAIESEYRRFLYLIKIFPQEKAAPLFDVDIFWHYHILDTKKYAADCENVFGHFMHHFPYLGLRGEEDEKAHHEAGARMQELYEETFGEPYLRALEVSTPASKTAFLNRPGGMPAFSNRSGISAKTAYSVNVPEGAARAKSATGPESSYTQRPTLKQA